MSEKTATELVRACGVTFRRRAAACLVALAFAACVPGAEARQRGGAKRKDAAHARAQGAKHAAGAAAEKNAAEAGAPGAKEQGGEAKEPAAVEQNGAREAAVPAKSDGASGEAAAGAGAEGEEAGEEGEEAGGVDGLRARAEAETDAGRRARLRHELAGALAAEGNKAEAVRTLRALAAEERFDPPHYFNVGNALARLGESSAAADAYYKAIEQRRGAYARAQHNLGVVLVRLGSWDEAERALKEALRLESSAYPEASYNLGRLYSLRGEAGLAIEEWTRTLKLKPDHAGAAVGLARALAEDGDPKGALAVLDEFEAGLARRGGGVPREVTVARGEILAARNAAAGPVSSGRRETKGDAPAAGTRPPSAAPRGAAASSSFRPLAVGRETYDLLQRARAARGGGRREEAVTLYRRAVESNGGYFAPANIELGYALGEMRRTEEAAAALRLVVRRDGPRYPFAYYHLGRFSEKLGRLDEAGEALARASELLGAESPQFYVDLSRIREKQGRLAEALAAAESYVSGAERRGGAPEWGRALVARLREEVARSTAAKD